MVRILFYTSTPGRFGTEITSMLAFSAEHAYAFQSVYTMLNLKQLLKNEPAMKPIAVLVAGNLRELDELYLLKQRHDDLPVILLLPDDEEETLKKAHRFRPKFLTTVHHDFRYVLSVVEKLSQTFCMSVPVTGMQAV